MQQGYTVLIVDDDHSISELISEYLSLAGFDSFPAKHSEEALGQLRKQRIDLILLDIQLNGKDGFAIMEEIRQHQDWRNIPVIFLSNFDRPNLKVKALEMGAEDYVTKPFDRAELLARIKVVLRRSHRYLMVENCVNGSLDSIPLPVLLQTLALGEKTASIQLSSKQGPPGNIQIKNGKFLDAKVDQFSGRSGLMRLLFYSTGSFRIDFTTNVATNGDEAGIDSLLLDCSSEIDEIVETIGGIDNLESNVELKNAGPSLDQHQTTVRDAIIRMPGDIKSNATRVAELLSKEPGGQAA